MKITLTTLCHASLAAITLTTLSSCGLKGPLVLEQVPVEKTQAPFDNSTDQIPVELPAETPSAEAEKSE